MAGLAQLKFVMTECSKTQIRLTRPTCLHFTAGESCIRLLDVDGDGLDDILLGAANSQDDFDVQAGVSTGKYSELRDFCLQKGRVFTVIISAAQVIPFSIGILHL